MQKTRDYARQIAQYWPTIVEAWQAHAARQPMIECDLANRKVYAYDSTEYIDSLSDRTREATRREFARTMAEGCIMVFVKDSRNRVLQSYVFPGGRATEEEADGKLNKPPQRIRHPRRPGRR